MNLNMNQSKLVELTMELDLKAREYKILCEKLDKLKKNNVNEDDEKLSYLREEFIENYKEIVEINKQIKELENNIQQNKEIEEKYNNSNIIFKKTDNINIVKENIKKELDIIKKDNLIKRLFKKMKNFFKNL